MDLERLPGVFEARKIQLNQLYLRIGSRHGQNTMLRVVRSLKPYLCFFSLVHLNMIEEPADIEETDQEALKGDFLCLLS